MDRREGVSVVRLSIPVKPSRPPGFADVET